MDEEACCRICYNDSSPVDESREFISPCKCSGSVKYVHPSCLRRWRVKGKKLRDIKTCEQCHGLYNIPGEVNLNIIIRSIIAMLVISIGYFILSLMFKVFIDSIFTIVSEISYIPHHERHHSWLLSNIIHSNDIVYDLNKYNPESIFGSRGDLIYHRSCYFTLHFHLCCIMLSVSVYKTAKSCNFFAVFNYIFTFWRLINFEFKIDMVLFLIFTLIFGSDIFNDIYEKVDGLFYYLKNL